MRAFNVNKISEAMQNYENNSEDGNIFKSMLLEYLHFLIQKIEDDKLSMSDLESLFRAFASNLTISGTAEDLAKFYDKSIQDIRNIAHRNLIEKPKRKVLYPFNSFLKIVPKKWRKF